MILSTNAYDPQEEEGRHRSSHVSGREIRVVVIILVIVGVLLWPVIGRIRRQADSDRCKANLTAISSAMPLYATDNNDRLPPLYVVSETNPVPKVFPNGTEFTWGSLISRYIPARAGLEDPAASDDENVSIQNSQGGKDAPSIIKSSYGMFGALSAFPINSIPSPSTTALIADSCNSGSGGSYDPNPFTDSQGKKVPDGIVIGFDNTNFTAVDSQRNIYNLSKYATRLPFDVGDPSKPSFAVDRPTRHPDGVHILTADGHLLRVKAPASVIQHLGVNGPPTGMWAVPY